MATSSRLENPPSLSLSLSYHERRWKRKVQTKSPSNAIPGDVLKKLYGKQRETTSGKSEMEKSLSPHYLLTIHYWTRYTRFRIPIAKSFPRRICILHPFSSFSLSLPPYRLPSTLFYRKQTNGPYHGHGYRPSLALANSYTRTYTNPRNKPVAEGNGACTLLPCLFRK